VRLANLGCTLGLSAAVAMLFGCGGSQPLIGAPGAMPQSYAISSKVKHVVIVVQGGRSFNDVFSGYPGAKTASYGYDSKNRKVALKPIGLATSWSTGSNFLAACNGSGKIPGTECRMNGFNKEHWGCGYTGGPTCPIKYPPYSYVPNNQTKPYFAIANQYVVADEMYASNFDGSSFVAHQYLIAAQAASTIGYPEANWGCPGVDLGNKKENTDWVPTILKNPPRAPGKQVEPCWDNKTLGDELDAVGDSWAFYANPVGIVGPGGEACGKESNGDGYAEQGIWSAYQAVKHICYGPDWDNDIISPPKQFFSDVRNGDLRAVTWITPTCADSDEAGCNSGHGPSWVASLVNAIGESKFWDSTAILIVWDGFGGWYDPEPPAYVDYDGLGIRVPLLIVSPYARRDYVSHVHYEFGSILRFTEDQFGLQRLAASDRRASSPERDCFDFRQPPRKFTPIKRT
jgi:phospholipase C